MALIYSDVILAAKQNNGNPAEGRSIVSTTPCEFMGYFSRFFARETFILNGGPFPTPGVSSGCFPTLEAFRKSEGFQEPPGRPLSEYTCTWPDIVLLESIMEYARYCFLFIGSSQKVLETFGAIRNCGRRRETVTYDAKGTTPFGTSVHPHPSISRSALRCSATAG